MASSSRPNALNRRLHSENPKTDTNEKLSAPFTFTSYRRSPLSAVAYNATASDRENLSSSSATTHTFHEAHDAASIASTSTLQEAQNATPITTTSTFDEAWDATPARVGVTTSSFNHYPNITVPQPVASPPIRYESSIFEVPLREESRPQLPLPARATQATCLREVYPISTRLDATNHEILLAGALMSPHVPVLIPESVIIGHRTRGYDSYLKMSLEYDSRNTHGQKRKGHPE